MNVLHKTYNLKFMLWRAATASSKCVQQTNTQTKNMSYTRAFQNFPKKTAFKLMLKLWMNTFPKRYTKWEEKNIGFILEEL